MELKVPEFLLLSQSHEIPQQVAPAALDGFDDMAAAAPAAAPSPVAAAPMGEPVAPIGGGFEAGAFDGLTVKSPIQSLRYRAIFFQFPRLFC